MNFIKSTIIRPRFLRSYPVSCYFFLVLLNLRSHLASDHRSLQPWAMVYLV